MKRTLIALALCGLAQAALAADPPHLPTVQSVDLSRYLGRWYEIALLPNRFERQCVSDTQAHYSLQGEGIGVLNSCRTAKGAIDEAAGRAKIVPGSGNAKLRVTFFWPFYGDYWILALDDDYTEVLVGSPDRRFAWILARRPQWPEARVQALLARAQALGFEAAAFQRVVHTPPAAGVPPTLNTLPLASPASSAP